MAGFSESNQERGDRTRAGAGDSQGSEYVNEFLSKIWNDLGWQPKDLPNGSKAAGAKDTVPAVPEPESVQEQNRRRELDLPPIPPFLPPNDSPAEPQTLPESTSGGKIFELRNLDNRAADHKTPDAVLRLPANFDPAKPIHLVIYNHGWGSNVQTAFNDNKLDEQMANAPANTVLIVPEWQRKAGANNGDQGHFEDAGVFKDMIQEIFSKTPDLNGKTLNDVASIGIFAHSAGYGPTETELNKNGLAGKVTSITLLDALYDNHGFDDWIKQNASQLNAGTKRFYNFFNDTSKYSEQLIDRMKVLLPGTPVLVDLENGDNIMDAATLASHPVVIKFSSATVPGLGPHWSMPHLYVGPVEAAEKANPSHI